MTTISDICKDLSEEHRSLDEIVSPFVPEEWDTPTPAPGWTVRDQISHLAFFDEVAVQAAADPDAFNAQLVDIAADPPGYMNRALAKGRAMEPAGVLSWWSEARYRSVEVFSQLEPDVRIPWFGPPMRPVSFVTGRLMETWAHGQDIVDAMDVERGVSERLRHVAHMGVRARGFSFQVNGQSPPPEDVLVELGAPNGETWRWGESSENTVRGSALDFALAVTQRRHLLDTDLEVEGPVAEAWMAIAQSFAGPPGEGRKPGQFPRRT